MNLAVSLLFGLACWDGEGRLEKAVMVVKDGLLTNAVRAAVCRNCAPGEFECMVGCRADINTRHARDKAGWERSQMSVDEPDSHAALPHAADVLYWVRPIPGFRVIGVYWVDGKCRLFQGALCHPD